MNLDPLLGALLVIIGAALPKIFDLVQKKTEHNRELKKMFFQRKMAVAESIVIQYKLIMDSLNKLVTLYSRLYENDNVLIEEANKQMLDDILKSIELTKDKQFIIANSYFLYFNFDFDNDKSPDTVLGEFYERFSGLTDSMHFLDRKEDAYENAINSPLQEQAFQELAMARKKLENDLGGTKAQLLNLNQIIIEQIKFIRHQMKKYD